MTFLNVSLAAGTAACLIPLIIHLLSRSRLKVIDWGAMHWIESAVETNARRIQWHSLLLLLVRCMIPITLALCLARPVLTVWKSPGSQDRANVVWLVDDSYSMHAPALVDGQASSRTGLEQSLTEIRKIITGMGAGTQHSIFTIGAAPVNITGGGSVDWPAASGFLNSIPGGAGACRMVDSLSAAATANGQANQPRRLIVLVSDFQQSQWEDVLDSTLLTIGERYKSMPIAPQVVLLPMSTQAAGNLSVACMSQETAVIGVGQSIDITTSIRNHSSSVITKLPVAISADHQELSTKFVDIDRQSQTQVSVSCQFDSVGSHVVSFKVADAASIRADDAAHFPVRVVDQIKVLVIADQLSSPAKGAIEEEYLRFALAPFASGRTAGRDLVQVSFLEPSSVSSEALEPFTAVLLGDMTNLNPALADWLRPYVVGGGTLLIFPGDQQQVAWCNSQLGSDNAILPFRFGAPTTVENKIGPANEINLGQRVSRQIYSHPALGLFNERENGDLTSAEFFRWLRLEPLVTTTDSSPKRSATGTMNSASPPTVLVSLDNGDPLITERKIGHGTVIQFACELNDQSSNLVSRPMFLPLIQQLVLVSTFSVAEAHRVETGQDFVVRLSDVARQEINSKTTTAKKNETTKSGRVTFHNAVIVTPTGLRQHLDIIREASADWIKYPAARVPGVYTFEFGSTAASATKVEYLVAANVPDESNLERLPRERLEKIAELLGAEVVSTASEFLQTERQRRNGKEIWPYLLILVVVLLFTELIIQQRQARTTA